MCKFISSAPTAYRVQADARRWRRGSRGCVGIEIAPGVDFINLYCSDVCSWHAQKRPASHTDQCPRLRVDRTQCGCRSWAAFDPGCVKTHTSAKCRKYNSPTRYRTFASRAQHLSTPRCAISSRCFYVCDGALEFLHGQDPKRTSSADIQP
jgi:hypothetical protein